ncbi:hypothetical protein RR46_00845 [Papilio xuthus]|uniref:Uncharacterized protein n=1 Tax=Papilio xuthus TaxID=66420 RepID=A0A0N1I2P2_PAPXU|nr:hypothetical protein RR46_00845 [Papilio xuthus]
MSARLVLNGLTAELGGERAAPPASPEPYHELEIYRQLLALPPRARTPDPSPPSREAQLTLLISGLLCERPVVIQMNIQLCLVVGSRAGAAVSHAGPAPRAPILHLPARRAPR